MTPHPPHIAQRKDLPCVSALLALTEAQPITASAAVCSLRPHPESGLQLDLAVGPGALQQEALVHAHVGGVEEASQRQAEDTQLTLLLVLFDLQPEERKQATIRFFPKVNKTQINLRTTSRQTCKKTVK